MVRIGIAGFGRVTQNYYAWALRALPNATIVWVADPDARALEAARHALPVADRLSFADPDAFERVDAVLVTAPPAEHVPLASSALAAGKAVYVEKPLALSPESAAVLVHAWRASGMVGMTGYVERFVPAYSKLKRALETGAAGSIRRVRTRLAFDEPTPPVWKRNPSGGGGALRDIAVHHADLLSYLFESRAVAVRARASAGRAPWDTAEVNIELSCGVRADCYFSSAGEPADTLEIEGERRTLKAHRRRPRTLGNVVDRVERGLLRLRGRTPTEPEFLGIMTEFLRAAESGRPATPDLADGERGVAFFVAAEKSVASGEWVAVDHAVGPEAVP